MALFIIERNFAEAISVYANDPDTLRVSEEVGVRWLYSFLSADEKKTYCLYEAPDAVREAARRLNVPADVIIEVDAIRGPDLPWSQRAMTWRDGVSRLDAIAETLLRLTTWQSPQKVINDT